MNAIANFEAMNAIETGRLNDGRRDEIKIMKVTIDD